MVAILAQPTTHPPRAIATRSSSTQQIGFIILINIFPLRFNGQLKGIAVDKLHAITRVIFLEPLISFRAAFLIGQARRGGV